MSEIAREIAGQPSAWAEAARRGAELTDTLPPAGTATCVVGCGTSLYVAQAYAALREALGQGPTDAFPASEFPAGRSYAVAIAISRSGTTTEVIRWLASVQDGKRIAIVGAEDSPVVKAADRAIVLGFADERSVVQTRFATSALTLLRAHLGEDLGPVIEAGERALDAPLPIDPSRYRHYVFLGRGWGVGLANEAALKLREAAQMWTESYPAMEFRHGPISVAGPETVVWALGPLDPAVLRDAAGTGATVIGGSADPMVELIAVQRTAVALAELRGLDPDRPRHLTRSVVLS